MSKDDKLRNHVANFLMWLLLLNTVATLTAVYLDGLGLMNLDNTVLLTLIAKTVTYAGAVFLTVTRHLFPLNSNKIEKIPV